MATCGYTLAQRAKTALVAKVYPLPAILSPTSPSCTQTEWPYKASSIYGSHTEFQLPYPAYTNFCTVPAAPKLHSLIRRALLWVLNRNLQYPAHLSTVPAIPGLHSLIRQALFTGPEQKIIYSTQSIYEFLNGPNCPSCTQTTQH